MQNEEIARHDRTVSSAMAKISEHKRRRTFFLGFSHSPVDFINTLVASQTRDLKVSDNHDIRYHKYNTNVRIYGSKGRDKTANWLRDERHFKLTVLNPNKDGLPEGKQNARS